MAKNFWGFVRNLPDGRVEICAQGLKDQIHQFLKNIQSNPGAGSIFDIEKKYKPPRESFSSFEVRWQNIWFPCITKIMMAGLFVLFILVWVFVLLRFQKAAIIFGLINLVFGVLIFLHHATDKLQINLWVWTYLKKKVQSIFWIILADFRFIRGRANRLCRYALIPPRDQISAKIIQ